jgi:hypothetical protein
MKRWVALAAVLAAVAAGLVVALVTRADNSAAQPRTLRGVVAQVRKSFGDNRLVRAQIDGTTLRVVVTTTGADGQAKSRFETLVLGAAVADWMRSHGEKPIDALRYSDPRANLLQPLPSTPDGPSIGLDTCKSATRKSQRGAWPPVTHTSVEWLPYLHGICVFRLRIASGYPVGAAPAAGLYAYQDIARKIFDPTAQGDKYRAFFEVDDSQGGPLLEIGPLPGQCSDPWVRPDLPSPFKAGTLYTGVGQCAHL